MKPHVALKSEHEWIQNTKFEPSAQSDVLRHIIEITREYESKAKGTDLRGTVVFDLDSTLFEVRSRTLRIVKEFARSPEAQKFPLEFRRWWLERRMPELIYTLEDTAKSHHFPSQHPEAAAFLESLIDYWYDRFFSDRYLLHDVPALGARDYVRRVWDLGAKVVYLTGRDRPNMEAGTLLSLRHWGFPIGDKNTTLVMKPAYGLDDGEFKDSYLRTLREEAEVHALFDNEPANFQAFEKNFPQAKLVFRHSTCSQKQAKPVARVYKIHDFLL